MSAYVQTQRSEGTRWKSTNHVSHSLGFDTTGHTARCPGSLNFILITFNEIPDRVVRMAENPEVISADIGEFLKVGLEYPGFV